MDLLWMALGQSSGYALGQLEAEDRERAVRELLQAAKDFLRAEERWNSHRADEDVRGWTQEYDDDREAYEGTKANLQRVIGQWVSR